MEKEKKERREEEENSAMRSLLGEIIKASLRHAREEDAKERGEELPKEEEEDPNRQMSDREKDTLLKILEIVFSATEGDDSSRKPQGECRDDSFSQKKSDPNKKFLYPGFEPGYESNWCRASSPITYGPCFDGVAVYGGTLPGSGFADHSRGIVLPAEIDGRPVTELRGTYQGSMDYIDAPNLKRVYVHFQGGEGMHCYCSPYDPHLCLSSHNKIEIMELEFSAKSLYLTSFTGSNALRRIVFHGTVYGKKDYEPTFFGEEDWGKTFFSNEFSGCRNLREVRGRFEADYGGGIFSGCSSLVIAPEIRISDLKGTFYQCRSLKDVRLCDGVKVIGDETFMGCISLEDIYIPDTVVHFGKNVFRDCRNLKTIHMSSNVTTISSALFYNCSSLRKVFLSDNITEIEEEAFKGCSSLSNPWIPEGLKKIGDRAFMDCKSVDMLFIPDSVEIIGENAFANCSNLLISCRENSYAHRYAQRNNLPFQLKTI